VIGAARIDVVDRGRYLPDPAVLGIGAAAGFPPADILRTVRGARRAVSHGAGPPTPSRSRRGRQVSRSALLMSAGSEETFWGRGRHEE